MKKNTPIGKPSRQAPDGKVKKSLKESLINLASTPAVIVGIFSLFIYVLLATYNHEYLRQVESSSMFLPTSMFYHECMQHPGGLLEWAGNYLTQYFYYPWIGAAICAILCGALTWLVVKAFRLPRWSVGLAAIPAGMIVLDFLNLGYIIFSVRSPGVVYSSLLGAIAAMAFFWIYRQFGNPLIRTVLVVAAVVFGYHFFGVFALLAGVICAIYEIGLTVFGKGENPTSMIRRMVPIAVAALAIAAVVIVPQAYHRQVQSLLMPANIYKSGVTLYFPNETKLWIPYLVGLVTLCAFALLMPAKKLETERKPLATSLAGLTFVVLMGAVFGFQYHDPNFRFTVAMNRALMECDWDKAIEIADKNQGFTPTRLNVLYTDIALMRKDLAGDKMFNYEIGSAPYNTTRKTTAMRDAGALLISYHFGRINNAYRWAMEYKVEYGNKPDYLKMMAKSALLNGEPALAKKYISTLSQTMFHKEWAEKYSQYIDNQSLMDTDPEFAQIKPLMRFRDHLGGDGGKLEAHIMPVISSLSGGTMELLNLSLICNMVQKNVDGFVARFGPQAHKFDYVPVHYQEAILLWAIANNFNDLKRLKVDDMTVNRFKEFQEIERRFQNSSEEAKAAAVREKFGKTYWYYYFFTNNMKTT